MIIEEYQNNSVPQPYWKNKIDETRWIIQSQIAPLIQKKLSFRRRMFISSFPDKITEELDYISLQFIQLTRCFDEIIIIEKKDEIFTPVYDFSLRDQEESAIENSEFEELVIIWNTLNIWDWQYITQAEWSSFDMIGNINNIYYLCVNNTKLSINELESINRNWIFEEVKPIIERNIFELKDLLSK